MSGKPWTPEQLALLVALYPHHQAADVARRLGHPTASTYRKAHALGLRKSAAFFASNMGGRIQRGQQDPAMIASRFQPGLVPWNKGLHYQAGGRSASTQFKPGSLPHTWVPVGSLRINAGGVLDRKISDEGRGPRDWEGVHRLVWKAAHGPIPPGHVIVFRPGRKSVELEAITLDAIECVHRAELARRNHPRSRSPELAKLVQLKGAITRQVNRIAREAQQQEPHA